ncbi:membrane fusion protein, multidrug efflux system [Marinobacter daqiaonensis]|uniref:Membrane fusion protein, multidrug efflux system n=1 Tax=Marinobacter daqiaonensis TaxID=650891 RepID=A0A1I6JBX3_9GAMM|nr:efflux RND transporter periplasmic adaptor subunit [Marinobacter daqiaonensis]SFR76495.1 membrane fusion protein, multidrug efflux system [Marinobacter daqiaonensis]
MSRDRLIAVGLSGVAAVLLVVWLATGDIRSARDEGAPQELREASELASVQVERRQSEMFRPSIRLQGQVEPWRRLVVSSRLSGVVESIAVELGQPVAQGDTLLTLSADERPAAIARSRARVRQLEADLAAVDRLRSDRLVSESEKLRLEAELASARADLQQAQLAMAYLTPSVPFDGVINARYVESGSFVQVGEPLFEVVQVDQLKVTGFVPQQQAGRLMSGQEVRITLLDGRELAGELTFVASTADPETRSFPIEARVPNPQGLRVAGSSASLAIAQPPVEALFISPALLSLGDEGRPGVLHVNTDDEVTFTPVDLLSVSEKGAWVSGAPFPIRLITRGGGFVTEGQKVRPVLSGAEG